MKYKCYFCHEIFPAVKAIDGFKDGYKVGFLCPCCGKNIKDDLVSTETVYESKATNKFVALIAAVFGSIGVILPRVDGVELQHYLIFGGFFLIASIYGYAKYGSDLFSQTLSTQPGPGKKSEKAL